MYVSPKLLPNIGSLSTKKIDYDKAILLNDALFSFKKKTPSLPFPVPFTLIESVGSEILLKDIKESAHDKMDRLDRYLTGCA